MTVKRWAIGIFSIGFLVICITIIPGVVDAYVRDVVNDAVSRQVESNREKIRDDMRGAIKDNLRDEESRLHMQSIIRGAISQEIEENGQDHFRSIFEEQK